MCDTCGCSDDAKAKIMDPDKEKDVHQHEREHAHIDENGNVYTHVHAHGHKHEHAHGHGHEHEHEHHHEHEHAHAHAHAHEHEHEHEHASKKAKLVLLEKDVLARNNALAESNRAWLAERRISALNFVSAPGAGKTTLLEKTINALKGNLTISVLEGDQETSNDAMRIKSTGCRVLQINTGVGCHLEADTVGLAMKKLNPPNDSLLIIENVGNLVCPALFDLGEKHKVVVLSVTEGEDKPLKYPHMFRAADILIINKIDLLPHLEFNVDECIRNAIAVNNKLRIFQLSASKGIGMSEWFDFLSQYSMSTVQ